MERIVEWYVWHLYIFLKCIQFFLTVICVQRLSVYWDQCFKKYIKSTWLYSQNTCTLAPWMFCWPIRNQSKITFHIFESATSEIDCICVLDNNSVADRSKVKSHSGRLLCEKEVINSLAKDWWSELSAFLQHPRTDRHLWPKLAMLASKFWPGNKKSLIH